MATQYGRPRASSKDDNRPEPKKGSTAERRDREPEVKKPDPSPSADVVRLFHKNASVDSRAMDIHHTLGPGVHQAASGAHDHKGGNSKLLLEGYTITGIKATPSSVLPSIIAALVRLGAKDSTT